MTRLLVIAAWVSLVAALATHDPLPPRDELPEWYVHACAEVSTC
jgi:hypothetical protein